MRRQSAEGRAVPGRHRAHTRCTPRSRIRRPTCRTRTRSPAGRHPWIGSPEQSTLRRVDTPGCPGRAADRAFARGTHLNPHTAHSVTLPALLSPRAPHPTSRPRPSPAQPENPRQHPEAARHEALTPTGSVRRGQRAEAPRSRTGSGHHCSRRLQTARSLHSSCLNTLYGYSRGDPTAAARRTPTPTTQPPSEGRTQA